MYLPLFVDVSAKLWRIGTDSWAKKNGDQPASTPIRLGGQFWVATTWRLTPKLLLKLSQVLSLRLLQMQNHSDSRLPSSPNLKNMQPLDGRQSHTQQRLKSLSDARKGILRKKCVDIGP